MKWSTRAFKALDTENRGYILKDELLDHIKASGTYTNKQLKIVVKMLKARNPRDPIHLKEFEQIIAGHNFVKNVLENNLIIPQF